MTHEQSMAFDRDAAARFAAAGDRDVAPFFAGRRAEIGAFDAALEEAHTAPADGGGPRAVFRIYQGAPGCGKTSLARHLRATHPESLFVQVDASHLKTTRGLRERICAEALDADLGRNIVSALLSAGMELLRMRSVAGRVESFAAQGAAEDTRLVVWADEAQALAEPCDGLAGAHAGMLGIPAVVVLTGLQTTAERVRAIAGLSRQARNAVVDMGRMSDDECADSTVQMLDAFVVDASSDARQTMAQHVAAMAYGWPQHLNGAQVALAQELVAACGNLDRVDPAVVERTSDGLRSDYYAARLDNGMMARDAALALALMSHLGDGHADCDLRTMVGTAQDLAKAAGSEVRSRKAVQAYLDDMVRHGLLARRRSPENPALNRWQVPVPSMVSWAESGSRTVRART